MNTTSGGSARRLGQLVRYHRQRQGLLQAQLAAAAGVGRNTISQLESGTTTAPKCLPAILAALDLNVTDILFDEPATAAPGSAPPLAHLTDAQLGMELTRLAAEMTARLQARPPATAVPEPGAYGVLSAVDALGEEHPRTGQ